MFSIPDDWRGRVRTFSVESSTEADGTVTKSVTVEFHAERRPRLGALRHLLPERRVARPTARVVLPDASGQSLTEVVRALEAHQSHV